jgi:type III secretion protein Q
MTAARSPAHIRLAEALTSPDATAFLPPRWSRQQARDAAAMARRCRPVAIRIGGAEIEAPLFIAPTLDPPVTADRVAVACRFGAGRLVLLVPAALAEAALAEAAAVSPRDLDPALAALLLETLLAEILPTLEQSGGSPIALESIDWTGAATIDAAFRCDIGIRHGFADTTVHIAADVAAWAVLRRAIDAAPKPPAPLAGLPVPLAIRIGAVRLALAELRGLVPGDVLLPDVAGRSGEALVVFGERWAHPARREPAGIRIMAPRQALALQDGGLWMTETDGGAEAVAAERLDELPVTLVFELGRTELPLAAVQGLAPGAVLSLGRDPGEAVDIIANGRRIGRGEIVQIEDSLGIRVVRLFGDD